MKFIIITEIGIEDTCLNELNSYLQLSGVKGKGFVSFELNLTKKNLENLFKFLVLSQSSKRVMSVISEVKFKDQPDLLKQLKLKLSNKESKYWFEDDKKFYARCSHYNSKLSSRDLEPEIGEIILNIFPKLKVSMDSADYRVLLHIVDSRAILGIDLSSTDLSKRQYKLINSGKSINATLAYHLIKQIDFKPGEILLDPNTKTAEIAIEAALYSSGMHNYYESIFGFTDLKLFKDVDCDSLLKTIKDSAKKNLNSLNKTIHAYSELLKDVAAGKSNAKVAGVLNLIEFSKVGIDWIDARFDKHKVHKIATILPSESKNVSAKICKGIYSELLYQIEYVLVSKGLVGVLINKPKVLLETLDGKKFKVVKKSIIQVGEQELTCLILQKN